MSSPVPDPFASRSPTPLSQDSGSSSGGGQNDREHPLPATPISPMAGHSPNEPLLASTSRQPSYVSSPLNPNVSSSRPESRGSMSRMGHDDSYTPLGVGPGGYPFLGARESSVGSRGSMLLYRLASDSDPLDDDPRVSPSRHPRDRFSMGSDSGLSLHSVPSGSKYPTEKFGTGGKGAFLAYAYDPSQDQNGPPDAEDIMHDPETLDHDKRFSAFNLRGCFNITVLILLVIALVCLFTLYPIITFLRSNKRNLAIDNNVQVNGTGQVPVLTNFPSLVDVHTPADVMARKGWDGHDYELVFSDEFNVDGRTFWPGDDPFWEAVDIWYGATQDMEWYSPEQATTVNGSLRLRLDAADPATNHGLSWKSAMLQSWNKFCFTGGYIEVSVSFPGTSSNVAGYWPGVWLMGNLGRPGYGASTDGLWPYSYNACDVGTFPNQTNADKQGPAAALHTDYGRDKYNFELSWLPGQRVSACTCSGSEHPGPSPSVGRGAPEIDVFEAQKNKLGDGGKVSQSAQFAPFSHDYISPNGTGQATFFNPAITAQNTYQGSALQQAVTALTTVPERAYFGTGAEFISFGFEYFGDPNDDNAGYITWQVDGTPSYAVTSQVIPADPLTEISQRQIAVEPMSIVLNLGMSQSFQPVDLTAMTFPGDLLIDYIRVYQRTDKKNIGCSPPAYPTADYIANHMEAYTNPNLTFWSGDPSTGIHAGYSWPRNSKVGLRPLIRCGAQ
ncbi:beta-glucan synthesis-associated [Hysterangium stoloniferum]|nr:beta-glucan synthesis-associated [Hysterangium stoloniferum]